MGSLFLKIFLWFWAAIVMAMVASVVATVFFPTQAFIFQAKNYFAFNLATTGRLGADLYETKGPEALDAFLGQIDTISAFRLHLISAQGEPLRTKGLPRGAEEMAAHALMVPTAQFKNLADHPLMAIRTTSDSGKAYVIMLELPVGVVRYFLTLTRGHLLRLSAALFASGLICFLFARYLTTPIKKLQSAVRKFSQGDLAVRVAPEMGKRTDEIANLARDFDAMAAQIEKLMHAHERLLRDIAHELRSPLTRLNVALEISRKHAGPEVQRYIDRIGQEAGKLSQLITELLTLSRLENAEPALQVRPVALEEIIGRIAQDAGFEGQARRCSVAFVVEQKCTLLADGTLIRSAIENVVRNALRFAPVGSQVEIVQKVLSENGERYARIVVTDGGPGVAEEALEKLFRPFFRAGHPKGRASGGAGLGL
ncbi:MAG: HAMP domain-containing protein, partial [Desulfobacterales bacterium]|nr:HAMP domain-containing protein [Desulfobacterales bacterium]